MKIYTKQGDKGTTAVYTKTTMRVDKDDPLLECYGTLDELNSYLGLICSQLDGATDIEQAMHYKAWLTTCQSRLFGIGFALSDNDTLCDQHLIELENIIDSIVSQIQPQTHFILPGGSLIASHLHVARTIARRAERRLISLGKQHDINALSVSLLNRMSDFLFVLARKVNQDLSIDDVEIKS